TNGGNYGAGGTINITGGDITATGKNGGAGIGSGDEGDEGTITLNWSATDSGVPAMPAITANGYGGNVKLGKDFIVKKDDGPGAVFAATGSGYVNPVLLSIMADKTLVPCGPARQITINIEPAGLVTGDVVTASVDGIPVTMAISGQTVAVESDSGYTLGSLSYTYTPAGGTETTETVQADESGVYSFTMPAASVTVSATFRKAATPWEALQAQLNAGGEVTLNADVTADEGEAGLIVPGGVTVTLDLNGHVINRGLTGKTDDGYVIKVGQNGNLTVVDSAPDAIHDPEITYTDPMDSTRIVTVTVNGGVITGGNNANGGGVYNMGTFTLSGGAICGNAGLKAGVFNKGTFTMTGGTISGNCCYLSDDLTVGGVYSEGT
ncbi:MAG: hypothetical protein ABS888_09540, partial [Eubacteriales bacterium]